MKEKLKYVYIAGAAIVVIAGACIFFCGGDDEAQETKRLGPEGVIEELTSAMKTGDFSKAEELCDTAAMNGYLNAYQQKWEDLKEKDSAAFDTAVKILAETEIQFTGMEEKDGVCTVNYTLKLDGSNNKHQATLKKERGEWKVVEITDKH